MKPTPALAVLLLAGTWCMATSVHAANSSAGHRTRVHTVTHPAAHDSQGQGAHASSSSDTSPSSGPLDSAHHTNSGNNGGACADGGLSDISVMFSPCSAHSTDSGSSSNDDSHPDLSWQSLLPGSIQ